MSLLGRSRVESGIPRVSRGQFPLRRERPADLDRARLWVMKGAGHYYSADIDALMAEAIAFVLTSDAGASDAAR